MKKRNLFNLLIIILSCLLLFTGCDIKEKQVDNKNENHKETVQENEVVEAKEKRMSLIAFGDVLLHGAVYNDAYIGDGNYNFSKMFTSIEPIIKDYDLKYYNQETIIGGKDLGVSHYPRFNSPDEIGLNLIDIGFNMVSLANNHSLDKNEVGILYSVDFWRDKDVVVSGQAKSFEERESNIRVYEMNGIKYAFLAYTDSTNGLTVPQGKEYLLNVYSDEQAKIDIDKIKDDVDVIIVSMHWGVEYTHTPTYTQKREAQYLSSLGVNLIIGSHPHVIMPVDFINDTMVIYSLGNFISAQKPLGLYTIIGLMVGMDIVVNEDKVTFENIDYKLHYTYCNSRYRDFKVIPFDELTDDILNNYKSIEDEYMKIVTREVNYD